MLVAVIDMKIDATTGADLNHLVRNIKKSDFIIFIQSQMKQLEKHLPREVMREDSIEPILLEQ